MAIEYHASTSDPFYNSFASIRGSYYGFPGYPTTYIDGVYEYVGGGSGNYNQYRSAFDARKGISSPFVINLDGNYSPQSYTGNIIAEIIATGTPGSNLRLRYAIVETDIEFSWGGEDSLYFVERSMFPSASGVSISMSQGDTLYDNQNFTFDPTWDFLNSYIAVFIQNETTKEIKQAAKWVIPIDVPNISYVGHYIDDSSGDNDGRADPGETVDMIVSLYNSPPFQPATNVTATISNSDPDITLINATSNYPDIPVDSTVDNASDPFSFSVDGGASVHRTRFIMDIDAQPNNYHTTDTVEIMIGRPDIIFVDNDGGEEFGNVENYFSAAIESLEIEYDMVSDSAIEMQFLDEYQVIVWFTGSLGDSTVTSESQTLLSSYLDGGGNLFITGQDIGQDIGGTPFYTDYLHSIFVTDDVNYYGVIGVTGDPIGDGLALTITGGGGANNQTSPSAISKTVDADSVFEYPGTLGPCGVRYGGAYKTVYFSFGFEAINDESQRILVLRRILEWFGLIQGVSESPGYTVSVNPKMKIYPNPFTSEASIQCSGIRNSKDISIEIYNLSGRLVRSFSLFSSHSSLVRNVSWDGTDSQGKPLPNGIYFCKLKSSSRVISKEKIIMVK